MSDIRKHFGVHRLDVVVGIAPTDRSTQKPASPDIEGDGKISLRDLLGLSPEAAR